MPDIVSCLNFYYDYMASFIKHFMTIKTAIVHILLIPFILSGCGALGVNNRLTALEQSGGGKSIQEQLAEQQALIDDLQKEIQTLRGRIQEAENSLKQKTKKLEESDSRIQSQFSRLDNETNSNKERIDYLEHYINIETSEKSGLFEQSGNSAGKEVTETDAYALAKQKFERGDLQGAREAFKEFIEKYPNSEQIDNAIFWIGETYFHEKWYEKAILEYQKILDQYPKGNKVPAALLKQGISFFLHGDKTSATLIMKELIEKYPETSESKIAAKKLNEFNK